jgi:hypothetical protein
MLFVLLSAATFGLWLWALPILAFFLIFALIAWDDYKDPEYGWAAVVLVGITLFFLLFTDVPVWAFLLKAWTTIAMIVAAWVGFGAVWSLPRWAWFYIPERVEDFEKRKDDWKREWENNWKRSYDTFKDYLADRKDIPPSPKHNKARIVSWMWFSVCDFLYCILHKAVKRFFNWVFSLFQGIYSAISNRAFAHFDELK